MSSCRTLLKTWPYAGLLTQNDDLNNIEAWRGIPHINCMLGGIHQKYIRYYQGDHQNGWALAKCDLRLHERRREVYETLGLKENEPYYEFA